ncbi:Acetyltransferase, GNAT family [Mycoplasmopsis meleagridis]|uniref:Acetyltransferase, GNAT family n=1 Tax=Mycoplasmopsis meleagridis ATCC 25294 TaxID=1264554 RepID=A0A0F5H025_9BACT|nr:GNAT family N-acetyltransferase [Mycoplasmopsis meleagridis]KKB26634.1 Acetyltransferase, GNAT family [Mycoplasmopsis meleagridis ATCC 25294]OAD18251.1 Acetyltransferase, GNAT family [Mycoplasmopsis meleagridis]VEU77688.1 acetyltransferase [Mycoplasmopsis meleagridis]
MIRETIKQDKMEIMMLLDKDPLYNLFLISDVSNFGLNNSFIKSYVIEEENKIEAFILIFNQTLLFYDPRKLLKTVDLVNLIEIHNIKNINVSEKMFLNLNDFVNKYFSKLNIHEQFFAKCNKLIEKETKNVLKASLEDIKLIVDSRINIPEFKDFLNNTYEKELELYEEAYKKGISHNFIIKDHNKNKVIAHAAIAASTDKAAMIGGVYCLKEYRNNGYATNVMIELTNFIIRNNKEAVLFYHNEKAGSIYRKIGYETFGKVYTLVINDY